MYTTVCHTAQVDTYCPAAQINSCINTSQLDTCYHAAQVHCYLPHCSGRYLFATLASTQLIATLLRYTAAWSCSGTQSFSCCSGTQLFATQRSTQLFTMLLRYTAVCHAAQVHSCLPLCSGTQLFAMLLRYAAVCHAAQVESYLPGCPGFRPLYTAVCQFEDFKFCSKIYPK